MNNEFLFDDKPLVKENPIICSLKNIPKIFCSNYWANTPYEKQILLYRPITVSTFAIDYKIWNLNPLGFHLTNVIIHAINSILVYILIVKLFSVFGISNAGSPQDSSLQATHYKDPALPLLLKRAALISALLFAVHTIHTEAVAGIVGRTELLSTLFFLSGLIYFLKENKLVSLISFFLALLCKESAVTLPIIITILLFLTAKQPHKWGNYKNLMPFIIIFIVYFSMRSLVLKGMFAAGQSGIFYKETSWTVFLTMVKAFAYYFRLLLYPIGLNPDYNDFEFSYSLFEKDVVISILFLLAIIFTIFKTKNIILKFGLVWIFATLTTVSNIIPIGAVLGERFLYLPSVGLCIAIASLRPNKLGNYVMTVLIIITIWWGYLTFSRNYEWKNDETLWSATLKYHPTNVKAAYHLAEIALENKKYDEAELLYNKSITYYPKHSWNPNSSSKADVYYKLGMIYQIKGINDKALINYEESIKLNPMANHVNYNYYLMLGIKNAQEEKFKEAILVYKEAMSYDDSKADVYYNLGLSYFKNEEFPLAHDNFEKAIELNPNYADAYINLGNSCAKMGLFKKAVEAYQKAIAIEPSSVIAKKNIELVNKYLKK